MDNLSFTPKRDDLSKPYYISRVNQKYVKFFHFMEKNYIKSGNFLHSPRIYNESENDKATYLSDIYIK